MSVLLLLCAIPTQPTPKEEFRSIAKALNRAESLRLEFLTKVTVGENSYQVSGTILFKPQHKVRVEIDISGHTQTSIYQDGEKALLRMGPGWKNSPLDRNYKSRFDKMFPLTGVAFPLSCYLPLFSETPKEMAEDLIKTRDYSLVKQGENTRVISYTLQIPDAPPVKVVVTYEPKTYKLIRRELSFSRDGSKTVFSESYKVYKLGAKISDQEFKLPR